MQILLAASRGRLLRCFPRSEPGSDWFIDWLVVLGSVSPSEERPVLTRPDL